MSPEPIFGPKICFFLRYTHITTFIWAQGVRLNRNISPTYPEVTLDTFGFPVGGRLAARRPVFRSQQPKVTFSRPKCENGQKSFFLTFHKQKSPVLGKTMFIVLLPLFASFFVHFQKLIRPHPSPLWGVFSIPKTFVNLPSVFLYAKIILRCQNMFYNSGEVISDQFNHITLDSKSGKF